MTTTTTRTTTTRRVVGSLKYCLMFLPVVLLHQVSQLWSATHWTTVQSQPPVSPELPLSPQRPPYCTQQQSTTTTQHKLLIAQYAGFDLCPQSAAYEALLNETMQVNLAYAKHWGHDYMLLRGLPYVPPDFQAPFLLQHWGTKWTTTVTTTTTTLDQPHFTPDCNTPASRATYNKLAVLTVVLNAFACYDRLLILDADAMMFDFTRDMSQWESNRSFVVAAHKTSRTAATGTGSINVGVTLWNVHHRLTPFIVKRWELESIRRIQRDRPDDDQAALQTLIKTALDDRKRHQVVYAVDREFEYSRGTFVRHFIRTVARWNSTADATRLARIQTTKAELCRTNASFVCFKEPLPNFQYDIPFPNDQ